jgi:hypothetical protein
LASIQELQTTTANLLHCSINIKYFISHSDLTWFLLRALSYTHFLLVFITTNINIYSCTACTKVHGTNRTPAQGFTHAQQL